MFFFSCKNNVGNNTKNGIDFAYSNIHETVNNINNCNNNQNKKPSIILLEGITENIYPDQLGEAIKINYKMNTIEVMYYNKAGNEDQRVGGVYFNGGMYSKNEIANYKTDQPQKKNSNNVYYYDYFVFSTQEYEDIRFERSILINSTDYIILILIKITDTNIIDELVKDNKQYFQVYDGEKYGKYHEDLANNLYPDGWLCWDHENGATKLFLENLINNENTENIGRLWINETEEIIKSIKIVF